MKYSTINYNLNTPMPKVVKAPLNSDIGVAIKVWKDGQLLDTDLSVDGLSATSTRNEWQLFELSSGSTPRFTKHEVVYEKENTYLSAVTLDPPAMTSRQPTGVWEPAHTAGIENMNGVLPDNKLPATWMKDFMLSAYCVNNSTGEVIGLSTMTGLDVLEFSGGGSFAKVQDGMWVEVGGTATISALSTPYRLGVSNRRGALQWPPIASGIRRSYAKFMFTIDSGDGLSGRFVFDLSEQDEGWMETKVEQTNQELK